jgi:aminobenzoyl-glutamate utilization protein B
MKIFKLITSIALLACTVSAAQEKSKLSNAKSSAIKLIGQKQTDLIHWNDSIWKLAEPSFKESRSVNLLIDILQKEGFTIQRNVSGFSTVFMATYGTAKPVIGLFGEYDADAGASNKIVTKHEELAPGEYGHGGGHNLLAVGSLGAALAIKDLIKRDKLKCTIRYYGTTAEGSLGTKTYLARDGFFNDLDLSLYWHPAPGTWAATSPWDALIDFDIIFSAKKINVIRDLPGHSNTLTTSELLVSDMKAIRAEMTPGKKINYAIRQWKGDVSNIPDTIKFTVRIQCARQEDALAMFTKIDNTVQIISDRTKVSGKIEMKRAMHQFQPNITAMQLVQRNMELLGAVIYSDEELVYAKEMQRYLNKPADGIEDKISPFSDQSEQQQLYGYASDIGDASWIAPEIYFTVRSFPPSIPMHNWAGTAFTAHSIGHKGMLQAAKIISMTIIDFVENKSIQESVKKEFEQRKKDYVYQSLLNDSKK